MELRKKWLLTLLLVMTFIIGGASADGHSIVDVAEGNGNFTVLIGAINEAGLRPMLDSRGPFTVFAPTDEAFAKIPAADLDAIVADKNLLRQILLYHVVQGEVSSGEVVNLSSAQTALGKYITIQADENGVVLNGTSMVTAVDIGAVNGVIHVIDTVLIPPAGWGADATAPPPEPAPPTDGDDDGGDTTTPPPTDNIDTKLADTIAKARFILEQMGGVLDRSDFGRQIACDEFSGYYNGLMALPTYTDEELPPNLEGIHEKYREAVDKGLETNMSIFSLCENGGTQTATQLNYSIARSGINDALNILLSLQELIGVGGGEASADPAPPADDDPPAADPAPSDPASPAVPPGIGADLLAAMEQAEMIIGSMGGLLDGSDGGTAINCDEFLALYEALQALPTYTDDQLPAEIEGIHEKYREAVDKVLATSEAIYLGCEGGGTKANSPLNYGVARIGINDGLGILLPTLEVAEPIIAALPPSGDPAPPAEDPTPEPGTEDPADPDPEPTPMPEAGDPDPAPDPDPTAEPSTPGTVHPVDRDKDGNITMNDYNILTEEYDGRWSRYNFDEEIIPWNAESFYLDTTFAPIFIQALDLKDPSGVSAADLIRQNPEENCALYVAFIQGVAGAPEYSGVPGNWTNTYNTYRKIIEDINISGTPLFLECLAGSSISDSSVSSALSGLGGFVTRLNAVEVMGAGILGVESFSAMGGWLAVAQSVEGNTFAYYFSADYFIKYFAE